MIDPARVGFGGADLANLNRTLSDEQATDLLETAWDAGIRTFDTAPHYGLGLSELRLGWFLAGHPREQYRVGTKVGRLLEPSPDTAQQTDPGGFAVPATHRRVWDFSARGVARSLAASLQRLGLDRVDVALLHDPEEHDLDAALSTGLPALTRWRDEGVVGAVGVGSKSLPALVAAVRTGLVQEVIVAGRYTLLEQPAALELLPLCARLGVRVVVAGVFNSGVLARPDPDAAGRYEYGAVGPEVLARARELAAACARHGVDLPTAALQFPLRHPAVHTVLLGAADAGQLTGNLRRLATPVPEALWSDPALPAQGTT